MEGECSCGAPRTCIHIAAVSLAAARESTVTAAAPHRTPGVTAPAVSSVPHAPSTQRQRLYYVLEAPEELRTSAGWHVSVWVSPEPESGRPLTAACRFSPRPAVSSGEYPRYVDAQDREVLQHLTPDSAGPWSLRGEAGARLLSQILATGRARTSLAEGQALRAGTPRRIGFKWHLADDGAQHLACEPGSVAIIPGIEPLMYVDRASSEAGMLELAWPSHLLRSSWIARVPPEDVAAINEAITRDPSASSFPLLHPIQVRQERLRSLHAQMRLAKGLAGKPEALVCFLYNGLPIEARRLTNTAHSVRVVSEDSVLEFQRDLSAEQQLREQIEPWLPATPGEQAWLRLLTAGVPALRAQGVEVIIEPDFPYQLVLPEEWYADVRESTQADWFDLKLGVQVAGRQVNLLPALTRYLETTLHREDTSAQDVRPSESTEGSSCHLIGEHWLLRVEDGRYLCVPLERIRRIAATLVELFDRPSLDPSTLPLPRAQGSRLAQLAGELEGLRLQTDDPSLQALTEDLRQPIAPLCPPASFQAALRPYQQAGLGWLQFLRRHHMGGVLADDMGLGKTVQALAHVATEKAAGRLRRPVLIVAPVSALPNWQHEVRRFLPALKLVLWHGSRRKESPGLVDDTDLLLTGYALLQLDIEILASREYDLVIFDEVQAIKNPSTRLSHAARTLRAQHRIGLTGTPVENHLGELWSLFDVLQPGLLGGERDFQRHYRVPIEKHGSGGRAQALSERIAPFLLRRTKESVATELPPKTEIIQTLSLDERQRDFYDSIRLMMHRRVQDIIREQGIGRSQITILDALLKLRQACCDPRLLDLPTAAHVPSAKLEWLTSALPQLVAEGRRILLFSQFTSMLRLIEHTVTELGIGYSLLTGSTRDRDAAVERFQSGSVPLFLISLRAGGTALNLTAADTVIHYDPWWNPAVEAQATDRAHRIGQDKPVFVYKLIAAATVEERIIDLKTRKQALASRLYVAHETTSSALTATDLEALFAP
jgi:superfamily II DNA or RNA helicase